MSSLRVSHGILLFLGAVAAFSVPRDTLKGAYDAVNDLNVLNAEPIQPSDSKYSSYQSVVQLLKQSLNTTADPCNDFYEYTCGNFNSQLSFDRADSDNNILMAEQMMDVDYVSSAPLPVKQVAWYFNQCRYANDNWNSLLANNGTRASKPITTIMAGDPSHPVTQQRTAGNPFPMLDQKSIVLSFPDALNMGYLLGYPMGLYGVSSLITTHVDTNWVDPQKGYAYYIDQPYTILPNIYYANAWPTFKPNLINYVMTNMNGYAHSQNLTLNQNKLLKDATDLVDFDYTLAMNFSTDDATRRQFSRSYNPMTYAQLSSTYPNIDWFELIPNTMLPSVNAIDVTQNNPNYQYIVKEPAMLQLLNDALVPSNKYDMKFVCFKIECTSGITPNIVLNYIYFKVLADASYFPWDVSDSLKDVHNAISKRRMGKRYNGMVLRNRRFEKKQTDDVDDYTVECAGLTATMLEYANARVFIDKVYPTSASRTALRNSVSKVINSVASAFRSMIDQLDWMSASTKKAAYNKFDSLVKNIAYPDWITDDTALTAYHATLGIVDSDDYFTITDKTVTFNRRKMLDLLAATTVDRTYFFWAPGDVNICYLPELNSITLSAGILRQPFFDQNWPLAVNFGALGSIAGHELTHGFDDGGAQWDEFGRLSSWMDAPSQNGFYNMAQCVVNEYSGFCPLNATQYQPNCVNGAQTQVENVADNGGIRSAFRGYKNYVDIYGPDPRLPNDPLQEFSADQLFFLSFAQIWCEEYPGDYGIARQLQVDSQSPSMYRVFGTIQNFPAFKDAFNCPTNSVYAPTNHCHVWSPVSIS